jgi:hypothetical protein
MHTVKHYRDNRDLTSKAEPAPGRHYRVASRNRQRSKETPTRAQACASRPTERPAPQSAEA